MRSLCRVLPSLVLVLALAAGGTAGCDSSSQGACGANEFECDGRCFDNSRLCDGTQQCNSGQDEANCPECGDDLIEGTEVCDGNDLGGADCVQLGFDSGTLACSATCTFDTSGCSMNQTCGNDTQEGTELCDGADLAGQDCTDHGFLGGTLTCSPTCDAFDTSNCNDDVCGNDTTEGAEVCDGIDLSGEDCASQGFESGTLACAATCDAYDTSACVSFPCGNDIAEGNQICDGSDLRGEDCVSQGFGPGTLACNATCDAFDTSGCPPAPVCGNDTQEPPEVCDGTDLDGEDCASQGLGPGTLVCNATCDGFDTSGCGAPSVCGNDNIEGTELCDGTDLDGEDCVSQGFAGGGTLACNGTCDAFDTSGCISPNVCGDNSAQGTELCDGTDLNGEDCVSQGYGPGTLVCNGTCDGFDTTGCTVPAAWSCDPAFFGTNDGCDCGCGVVDPDCADATVGSCAFCNDTGSCDTSGGGCPGLIDLVDNSQCRAVVCGDNLADPGEACDGSDLSGEDCVSQGFSGGTLLCNGTCDGFDTTGCLPSICGDNVAGPGEACDGTDLNGEDCVSQGFVSGGTLACQPGCGGFDTSGCLGNQWTCDIAFYGTNDGCDCGCGVVDPDCADATFGSCVFCNNTGSCDTSGGGCPGFIDPVDNSQCTTYVCGDNVAEGNEACDGTDLAGEDCISRGFTGGTLACTGFCNFDVSGCTVPPAWTCPPQFYGASDGCDCGCGVVDPDCPDATAGSCQFCNEAGSCDTTGQGCPGIIDPVDNSQCN